jgi:hypothetical protein
MDRLKELCEENRTGQIVKGEQVTGITNIPYNCHEIKVMLNQCKVCDDYVTMEGKSYCIVETEYQKVAKKWCD